MSESDRKHVDGCAIFYKTEKYELHSSCVNELIWTVVLLLPGEGRRVKEILCPLWFIGFYNCLFAEGWGKVAFKDTLLTL